MELRQYIRIVRERIGLIAVITILAAVISFGVGALLPPDYQATTSVLVNTGSSSNTESNSDYSAVLTSQQLAMTYSELLTKRPVIEATASELGLDPNELKKKIRVQVVPNTTIIELTVNDGDPRLAAEIANRVIAAFKENATGLSILARDLVVFEPAAVPTAPDRNTSIYVFLGAITGFVFSFGLALLLDYLSDAIETIPDIRNVLGVTPLGAIPKRSRSERADRLITLTQPHAPLAEAYRSIRTQLHLASAGGSRKTLLVTSAEPSTGKTTLTANLGVALAQASLRIVIIDANVRFPALHEIFNTSNTAGLTDWLAGDVDSIETRLKKTALDNLQIIPSGPLPPDPAALLGSARMDDLLAAITQYADWIILDAPAVEGVTDAIELARKVDGVILVVQAARTSRQSARQACEALKDAGATILGAVMTKPEGRRLALRRPVWLRAHHPFSVLERVTKVIPRPKPEDAR